MNQKSKEVFWRGMGMLIPIAFSAIALAVHWGVVTTRLSYFESRLKEVIQSVDKQGDVLVKLQQDIAFIKGKLK